MAALASEFASRVTDIWCITTERQFADLRFADLTMRLLLLTHCKEFVGLSIIMFESILPFYLNTEFVLAL